MISDEGGAHDGARAAAWTPWRRGLDVLDDYSGGGVLSEELADDLVNELVGLVGSTRPRRPRRTTGPHPGGRPGPQPSRPAVAPPSIRPRLTIVRGGG
jgi:hypothetical protein